MPATTLPVENESVFNPKVHLAYDKSVHQITMDDLHIPMTSNSSSVAGTKPFRVLSPEGVVAYRKALFSPDVVESCAVSPRPGALVMRGPAKYSRFIHDFWTHEETMKLIANAIGVPLSIVTPIEIGHTNIQTKGSTAEEMKAELRAEPLVEKIELSDEDRQYNPLDNDSVIPWHYDSYPYVCVLMISDTQGMVGGETYIKGGDGKISKIEGPMIGHACMLQGGQVEHMASRAIGVTERITTITSYRAVVPNLYDSSYTSNLRPYSKLEDLYQEWALYRLAKMKEEIEALQTAINSSGINNENFATFVEQQTNYLQRSSAQMVPPGFHKKIIAKHGKETYYACPRIWDKLQLHPRFEELSTGEGSLTWMPHSTWWIDYYKSVQAIKSSQRLESELGRFSWHNVRPYTMGDELLRQGVREYFLDWLDATGLSELM